MGILSFLAGFFIALLWHKSVSYKRGYEAGMVHQKYRDMTGYHDDDESNDK